MPREQEEAAWRADDEIRRQAGIPDPREEQRARLAAIAVKLELMNLRREVDRLLQFTGLAPLRTKSNDRPVTRTVTVQLASGPVRVSLTRKSSGKTEAIAHLVSGDSRVTFSRSSPGRREAVVHLPSGDVRIALWRTPSGECDGVMTAASGPVRFSIVESKEGDPEAVFGFPSGPELVSLGSGGRGRHSWPRLM